MQKQSHTPLDEAAFEVPFLWVTSQAESFDSLAGTLTPEQIADLMPMFEAYDSLPAGASGGWRADFDRITGKPMLLEGALPWIPGAGVGNWIRATDIGVSEEVARQNQVPVDIVAAKAIEFLRQHPGLFGIDDFRLVLETKSSGPVLDNLYFVHFNLVWGGYPVEKARIVFRLNSGNLVQVGQELVADSLLRLDPTPLISREGAWAKAWAHVGGSQTEDEIVDSGRLVIVPISTSAALSGDPVAPGTGLEYRLVWVLSFRRPGEMGIWESRVDARSGELLSFFDSNHYGLIRGGTYKTDKPSTAVNSPFPMADYGAGVYADTAGVFPGLVGTSTMLGRVGTATTVGAVDPQDSCGTMSRVADAAGVIDFGTSGGTDCTTPGTGGAGNTHSSRTQYWNISQIKIKAYTYLPGNNWLEGRLTANVNINNTCNAYWNGTSVNFFRSGGGCTNTGELPGVSLHEWGHGMDTNDGNGGSPDRGTGETYGDTSAFLQTHGSCIGGGFLGGNCGGYGDPCTACTGVRDVDYARHSNAAPETVGNPMGGGMTCPASATYQGPCTREGHCESYPSSESVWDLANRDLITWGMDATSAWQLVDRLWYASRPTATGAYACGINTSCAAGNLFTVFRVVDDCDGNLANGTPHASAIWNAFSRHRAGCATAVNTDNNCGCAVLATPALAGTPGNNQNVLTWGAIAGASSYDVYRNETNCTAGFTKIGNTALLTFTDTLAVNGTTYYYRIQAKGIGACPPSPMSNCVTLTPVAGCTNPTSVNVTPDGTTTACTGTNIVFTAVPVGGSGLTYQWTEDGVDIAGQTAVTLTITKATAQSHVYNCKVRGAGCGVDIIDATAPTGAWVAAPTTVDVTPNGTTSVCLSTNIVYTATVTGGSGLTYQWTEDGVNIAGATTSTYTANKATAQSHTYNCRVTSTGCATVVLDATASTGTWVAAPTSVDVTPNGTTTVCSNVSITFTATVVGGSGLTYQWTEDGVNLGGQTASTLNISKASAQSHTYNCRVTSTGCATAVLDGTASTGTWTAGSNPTSVDVTPNGTTTVCRNVSIVFTATPTGGSSLTYQWTEDGIDLAGQTATTLTISKATAQSHTYNCRVTGSGCGTGVSDATASTGTWTACAPNVVYQSFGSLTEICGDGDAVVEPGEQWNVTVTLSNSGTATATSTAASLTLNAGSVVGAIVSGNPGAYGNIAPAGTANATFTFTVSQSAVCVNDITFDVTAISSTEGSYPSQIPAFTVPVGSSITENATQVTTPLSVSSGAATSDFAPAFTLASATSATVSYNLAYGGAPVDLVIQPSEADTRIRQGDAGTNFGTETTMLVGRNGNGGNATNRALVRFNLAAIPAGSTINSATLELVATARNAAASADNRTHNINRITAAWVETTATWTNMNLNFDAAVSGTITTGTATGLKVSSSLATLVQAWVDGTFANDGVMIADNTGSNASDWAYATRENGTAADRPLLRINYAPPGGGDPTTNVQVELIDPSATATVLKAFGVANATPYNVTTLYTGPGTYRLRLSENAGLTATVTGGTMSASLAQCDISSCGLPGEIIGETWGGTKDTWSWAADANSTGYVVYRGTQADLPNLLNATNDSCTRWTGAATSTGPILTEDPVAVPGRFYWYITVGTNPLGEGTPGNATAGPRNVDTTGVCP